MSSQSCTSVKVWFGGLIFFLHESQFPPRSPLPLLLAFALICPLALSQPMLVDNPFLTIAIDRFIIDIVIDMNFHGIDMIHAGGHLDNPFLTIAIDMFSLILMLMLFLFPLQLHCCSQLLLAHWRDTLQSNMAQQVAGIPGSTFDNIKITLKDWYDLTWYWYDLTWYWYDLTWKNVPGLTWGAPMTCQWGGRHTL